MIELLLGKGVNIAGVGQAPIESVFSFFRWSLDTALPISPTRTEEALRSMEILASNGARWAPDRYQLSWLRRTLCRISRYQAIQHLQRIANSGIINKEMFKELMRTPKMKEILKQSYPGVAELRRFAGRCC